MLANKKPAQIQKRSSTDQRTGRKHNIKAAT